MKTSQISFIISFTIHYSQMAKMLPPKNTNVHDGDDVVAVKVTPSHSWSSDDDDDDEEDDDDNDDVEDDDAFEAEFCVEPPPHSWLSDQLFLCPELEHLSAVQSGMPELAPHQPFDR